MFFITSHSLYFNFAFLKRSAFPMTETELKLMAAAAIMGDIKIPNIGKSIPAAMGTPMVLYTNAKKRFSLIFRITLWLRFLATTMSLRSPLISMMEAFSIAPSVPVPIAIPPSACARAGASLIPSPAIATTFPSLCSFLIASSLSSGRHCPSKCFNPSSSATALAVFLLSPSQHHHFYPFFH